MKVTKLNRHIGALIEGIDLNRTVDATAAAEIKKAVYENRVVFFRDQDLSEERQIEFTRELGPVVETFKRLVNTIYDSAEKPPEVDEWHTDVSNTSEPPAMAILQARVIPEFGGDTMWVSLPAIWKSLSPVMQELARGLRVKHGLKPHVLAPFKRTLAPMTEEQILKECQAVHPLVRTHPVTGEEILFLSERFVLEIDGMHPTESKALLDYLEGQMDNPNFQMRWHWRPYDIAIWDEPSTNHRALSDHFPQYREMRRTTVGGVGKPYYRPNQQKLATVS